MQLLICRVLGPAKNRVMLRSTQVKPVTCQAKQDFDIWVAEAKPQKQERLSEKCGRERVPYALMGGFVLLVVAARDHW